MAEMQLSEAASVANAEQQQPSTTPMTSSDPFATVDAADDWMPDLPELYGDEAEAASQDSAMPASVVTAILLLATTFMHAMLNIAKDDYRFKKFRDILMNITD